MYKENLGFLVAGGLIILPNSNNTPHRSQFNASTYIEDNNLYIRYRETTMQVVGIVHTHPDGTGKSEPTPVKDYPYAYLGIHNYIISKHHLYDAFYNARGREVYYRIGSGKSLSKSSPLPADFLRLSSNP